MNPSLSKVTLLSKCPSCGKSSIYSGILSVKDKCESCGFALKEHDAGDGPAFFSMFITGTAVTVAAVLFELKYTPPAWMHIVIWPIFTIALSIILLRMAKSFLIGLQYKYKVLGFKKD